MFQEASRKGCFGCVLHVALFVCGRLELQADVPGMFPLVFFLRVLCGEVLGVSVWYGFQVYAQQAEVLCFLLYGAPALPFFAAQL